MANGPGGSSREGPDTDEPLSEVDPELNIFALANGLDLLRDDPEPGDRTLEWYRDGMDRRIRIHRDDGDTFSISVGASRKRDGVPHVVERTIRPSLTPGRLRDELRSMLAEGIEAANALERDELEPPPGPEG